MRCRRTTVKAAESLNVGGVSGGAPATAVGGASSGKMSEAQVTRASGGRSINVEKEVSIILIYSSWGFFSEIRDG